MRYIIIIFIPFFIYAPILKSQNTLFDSLDAVWKNEQFDDTIRLQALKDIIIKKKYYLKSLDTAVTLTNEIINFSNKRGIKKWTAEGLRLQGLSYYFNDRYEEALERYEDVLRLKREINDKKGEGSILHNMAVVHKLLGDLPKALEHNLEALNVRKEIDNKQGIAISLQSIATVYYNQYKYEEALKYAEDALGLSKEIGYDKGAANAAVSIANAYTDLGNSENALKYYNEALEIYTRLGNFRNQATCNDNIGNVYLNEGNYNAALKFQQKALDIRLKQSDKQGLSLSYINLGTTHYRMGQNDSSIANCNEGLKYAQGIDNLRLTFNAYQCLYETYEAKADIVNAYHFYKKYITVKDSVEGVEKTKLIEEIESKYELKDKEAVISQRELEISQGQTRQSNTIIISLLLLGLVSSIFIALRVRLLKRRKEAEYTAEKEHLEAEKLRELDKIKTTFFTNISHEFRTPLTLIMSPLEQMINGTLKGDIDKYLKIMHRNGQRLKSLINQLLDLSKLESGYFQLNLKEADLSNFLHATADSFTNLADRKQIEYTVLRLEDHMKAYFDKDVLEKILMNIISNAFKFTPAEGKIKLSFEKLKDQLIVTVRDNGIGIPKDQINTIFDRFYSTNSGSEVQMSSGIGLALTKELVELHEGKIEVESEPEKGSTFRVSIPMFWVSVESNRTEYRDSNIKNTKDTKKPLNSELTLQKTDQPLIMLVEDNLDVRSYMKEQLIDFYNIIEAGDGIEGLEAAKKVLPDLVISDIMMPKMDGNELCKALKTEPLTSHIPVILLTAKGELKDKIEGLETGADAYLTKPFDQVELQVRIKNLIEQRKLLRGKFSSDFKFAPSEVTLTSVDAQFLNDVKEIIETNMEDETFSVEELSKHVGMSRSNLFRKLKALTDQSPNQVLREMRLIRAKELLEKGAGNSAEVAYMVGFNSPTYFSKCFNDFFGMNPSKV